MATEKNQGPTDEQTRNGRNGTGLGLAIVDQIVSRAGGSIRIDSELGKGMSVRLYVPRIAAAAA